jgi:hypothetical protein
VFLANGSINTATTIEELLKAVFSVGSSPRLYNKDYRPAVVNLGTVQVTKLPL